MEKKEIEFSYEGTYVKTTNGIAVILLILATIIYMIGMMALYNEIISYNHNPYYEVDIRGIGGIFYNVFIVLILSAIFKVLSKILFMVAKKIAIMNDKYDFIEEVEKENEKSL
jgi:uncharacterized membrane protein